MSYFITNHKPVQNTWITIDLVSRAAANEGPFFTLISCEVSSSKVPTHKIHVEVVMQSSMVCAM